MKIISNRKPEISRELKFPIGFQIIEEVLSEIPLEMNLILSFADSLGENIGEFAPYSFGSKITLKNEAKEFIHFKKILTINYSSFTDKLTLTIYPCEKMDANTIKNFLVKNGLSLIKNWLNEDRSETWFEGHRFLQIGLNENFNKYCIMETLNEYITFKHIEHYTNTQNCAK